MVNNDLTGEFDVVAEFTLPAANLVLAAMHSANRLPHSWSLRVDDNLASFETPHGGWVGRTVRGIVDQFGDPVTDPVLVALAPSSRRGFSASDLHNQKVDPVVNPDDPNIIHAPALGDYGHLKGVAQLQFGAPTISLPDDSGTSVTLHTPVMARYIGDPETMPIPQYSRGEIQMTLGVEDVSAPAGPFINVNLVGVGGNINFGQQSWPPQPLSAQHLDAINKALRNSLLTSFQPSSTPLPGNISNMQFKSLPGALAVLMRLDLAGEFLGEAIFGLPAESPNPDSVNTVFLGDKDDFVLVVRGDLFQPAIDTLKVLIKSQSLPSFGGYTVHVDSVTVDFQDADPASGYPAGRILLTINGGADTDSALPNIGFTISQAFRLNLVTSDLYGSTADLGLFGEPHVDAKASGPAGDAAENIFKAIAPALFKNAVNKVLGQINPDIEKRLSADQNLGVFLTSLMNPDPKVNAQPVQHLTPQLTYTSPIEIRRAGVILHGTLEASVAYAPTEINFFGLSETLEVPVWPPAHAEFAQIPVTPAVPWATAP